MPYSYSCTISSLVKILFVQLRYLYIQYAWISIMKKKNINQNMKVERTRYFSKCLAITITGLNFFNCPAKLKSNLKLKFRSKFNHGFTNHGYLHSAIWKAFHNFETKRAQEARHNHFFYQIVKNNEIFEIFKMLALFSTGNTFFWVNLVQKLKIVSLSSNFVSRLIKIYTFPWWCSLFLFSTGNTFLGKFGLKNQNRQVELKFRSRLMWICRTM